MTPSLRSVCVTSMFVLAPALFAQQPPAQPAPAVPAAQPVEEPQEDRRHPEPDPQQRKVFGSALVSHLGKRGNGPEANGGDDRENDPFEQVGRGSVRERGLLNPGFILAHR